jgi:adenine-specific DNA-methyltransferase
VTGEAELVQLSLLLGAAEMGGALSPAESRLIKTVPPAKLHVKLGELRGEIRAGGDPLGELFYRVRGSDVRRATGAVYTPASIVQPMVAWTLQRNPQRIIDAGSGSGRFTAELLRRSRTIDIVAVDLDPLASLMTRAVAKVLGAKHFLMVNDDYVVHKVRPIDGRTAYIGNPPYVRHHQLDSRLKSWGKQAAASIGLNLSGLAGLHAYFFLATALSAQNDDFGTFVTSGEWLDVNYGSILRDLISGRLGGQSLHVVEPTAMPFHDTATTALVTTFCVGARPKRVRVQDVTSLGQLGDLQAAGTAVPRERLLDTKRWSGLLAPVRKCPTGFVELGELCRVHRGQVTGHNATWILRTPERLPASVLFRTVTRAVELFRAGDALTDDNLLRHAVNLPADLDSLDPDERRSVEHFLRRARAVGADQGYVAKHRQPWWSIKLTEPAPILATYMARRPPAFVLNTVRARHINVAHGLYPRVPMDGYVLERLARSVRAGVTLGQGRVYAGGLTKFEPREMEHLLVHDFATLQGHGPLTTQMES